MCTKFGDDEWITSQIIPFAAFSSFLSGKSTAAAAEILQQQHPFESKQNVKLPLYTKFGENKWITSRIIQFAAFTSLMSGKSAPAAAAVLQLQQQWPFESIQIIKLPMCTKFGDNIWITSRIIQFAAFALCLKKVLQLQ